MKKYELTGGARIGKMNATYPFAKLKVSHNCLEINVAIFGKFVFSPEDVISIKSYRMLPIIGEGLRITHRNPKYNEKVVFWTLKNAEIVLKEVKKTGFLNNLTAISEADKVILSQQEKIGFAIKKSIIRIGIIIFVLGILIDIIRTANFLSQDIVLYGMGTAIGFLFVSAFFARFSKSFQRLIFKDGYNRNEVTTFVLMAVKMISFVMLLNIILSSFN